jgi:deoxyadenosine/deoxycytidine kinase
MVYQRQDRQSTQNYLQRKKYKEWYTNVKANDQLKIIYNEKNINKAKKKICVFTVTCKKNIGSVGLN